MATVMHSEFYKGGPSLIKFKCSLVQLASERRIISFS